MMTAVLLAGGCAATRPPEQSARAKPIRQYTEASAAALPFDPPIDLGEMHPEFARAPRQPMAFLGFEEPGPELHIRGTTDIQTNGWGDFYAQESLSVRSSVLYR